MISDSHLLDLPGLVRPRSKWRRRLGHDFKFPHRLASGGKAKDGKMFLHDHSPMNSDSHRNKNLLTAAEQRTHLILRGYDFVEIGHQDAHEGGRHRVKYAAITAQYFALTMSIWKCNQNGGDGCCIVSNRAGI